MLFNELAEALCYIEQFSERLKITELLSQLLASATPAEARIIVNFSLGRLVPIYEAHQFLFGEKLMISVLAEVSQVSEQEVENATYRLTKVSDFLRVHCNFANQPITVEMLFNRLMDFSNTSGNGAVEGKKKNLIDLFLSSNPVSVDIIIRIILGKLRLGFSVMTLLDAITVLYGKSKQLRQRLEYAYSVSADLGGLIYQIKQNGIDVLDSINIVVGVPIVPAAAERVQSLRDIFDRMNPVIAQPKFDGMRIQVHVNWKVKNGFISIFSRHLHNISDMFPEINEVLNQYKGDWENVIFEGEVVAYDVEEGKTLPFQETAKRKRKHNVDELRDQKPLKMFVFDILYANNTSLLTLHHDQRRSYIDRLIHDLGPQETVLMISELNTASCDELQAYFDNQIENGLEGIIAKRTDVPYTPGKRNFNWIKFKRMQSVQLQDDIDVVILGYYYGKGKRSLFGVGSFLVGVFNAQNDSFETIAKVGTGFSDDDFIKFKQLCDEIVSCERPVNVVCSAGLTPDVWVLPQIVLVVHADEITLSLVHSAGAINGNRGYALRFPRFIKLASDKEVIDATRVTEIITMYQNQSLGSVIP